MGGSLLHSTAALHTHTRSRHHSHTRIVTPTPPHIITHAHALIPSHPPTYLYTHIHSHHTYAHITHTNTELYMHTCSHRHTHTIIIMHARSLITPAQAHITSATHPPTPGDSLVAQVSLLLSEMYIQTYQLAKASTQVEFLECKLFEAPPPEAGGEESPLEEQCKQQLCLFRARLHLMTRNVKACKKELKSFVLIAGNVRREQGRRE